MKVAMEQPPKIDLFGWIVVILALTMMVLGIFGCATQKKAEKYYKKHPVELAKECSEKYPVRDTILKGDTVTIYDTLWGIETYTDTLISEPQVIVQTKTVTVPKVVTKTVTIRDTVVRENTAKVYVLNNENAKPTKEKEKLSESLTGMTEARDKWRKRFFILLFGVIVYFGIKYRKLFKL